MNDPANRPSSAKRKGIREQSQKVEKQLEKIQDLTASQIKRMKQLEYKNSEFQARYLELVSRTEAVCHDVVLNRPRGDTWGLAFAYLTNYSLAQLGLARQCGDKQVFDAMILNLTRLADAMSKSFSDRKLVMEPWRRAVNAFDGVSTPTYETKPHPHVDSISPLLLTLRDTGPSLTDFREFYAPTETGLHIIRPA